MDHGRLRELRDRLAARAGRPAAFGWSPQVLHGAAQYRIDGPPNGSTLLVTVRDDDAPSPLAGVTRALSRSEAGALATRGRPVLHVEVDGGAGIATLLGAVGR